MSGPSPRLEGGYCEDVLSQPQALATLQAALSESGCWQDLKAFLHSCHWRRIVLTGMGASFQALQPLQLRMMAAGHTPLLIETSELIHYALPLCDEQTLIVAVSQSGASAETVRLLDLNRRSPLLGISNTPGSPLAQRAHHTLLLHAGPECSVACKTYLNSLLVVQWLGAALTATDERIVRTALETAAERVSDYLRQAHAHVAELIELATDVRQLYLTGRGVSLASAGAGALIVKEAARMPAEGMSSAAFRHGPMELMQAGRLALVFEGASPTRDLNRVLVRDLTAQQARAQCVGVSATLAALRLPECDALLLPLLEILPIQMLTLALASIAGREAGKFERVAKITDRE